jgi:hypothetical protein
VGPRAGLDRCGKSRPNGIRFPERPARSESLYRNDGKKFIFLKNVVSMTSHLQGRNMRNYILFRQRTESSVLPQPRTICANSIHLCKLYRLLAVYRFVYKLFVR